MASRQHDAMHRARLSRLSHIGAGWLADGAGCPAGTPLAMPPLVELISEDPLLRDTKLIAEAWDCDGLNQAWPPHPAPAVSPCVCHIMGCSDGTHTGWVTVEAQMMQRTACRCTIGCMQS